MKKILLATNNGGKVERFRNLLKKINPDLQVYTPKDLGIDEVDVEENGASLLENAEIKARAYFGKADMPILANDTGYYVEGEGLINAPKRLALGNAGEESLTKEEVAGKLLEFWKGIANKYGGEVDAAWVESFVALYPDGELARSESRREVVMTDKEFGKAHIQMPVRALYISKATGKPAILHTEEDELHEMQPVTRALAEVLSHLLS